MDYSIQWHALVGGFFIGIAVATSTGFCLFVAEIFRRPAK